MSFLAHVWQVQLLWLQDPLLWICLVPICFLSGWTFYNGLTKWNNLIPYYAVLFSSELVSIYGFWKHW